VTLLLSLLLTLLRTLLLLPLLLPLLLCVAIARWLLLPLLLLLSLLLSLLLTLLLIIADAIAAAIARYCCRCRRRWLLCAPIAARLYLDVLSLLRSSCKRLNRSPRTSNHITSSALPVRPGQPSSQPRTSPIDPASVRRFFA
jgi:hypothetical protein